MKYHRKVPKKQVVGEEMNKNAEHSRIMANYGRKMSNNERNILKR